MKGYQFVWSRPFMLEFVPMEGSWKKIYDWVFLLGWLEIRKWAR
jgi:hypothetical protein